MTNSVRSTLLSLRPDILESFCRLYRINTKNKTKKQIVSRISQSQGITILSTLAL